MSSTRYTKSYVEECASRSRDDLCACDSQSEQDPPPPSLWERVPPLPFAGGFAIGVYVTISVASLLGFVDPSIPAGMSVVIFVVAIAVAVVCLARYLLGIRFA